MPQSFIKKVESYTSIELILAVEKSVSPFVHPNHTAIFVFNFQVFPNKEDLFFKNIEVQFDDPHVERVRR